MTQARVQSAIEIAVKYGGIDGDHHKAWVIDQMVRALTGCPMEHVAAVDCNGVDYQYWRMGESLEYKRLVQEACEGPDGPATYGWNIGIAP